MPCLGAARHRLEAVGRWVVSVCATAVTQWQDFALSGLILAAVLRPLICSTRVWPAVARGKSPLSLEGVPNQATDLRNVISSFRRIVGVITRAPGPSRSHFGFGVPLRLEDLQTFRVRHPTRRVVDFDKRRR